MKKIRIVAVGKHKFSFINQGLEEYQQRLEPFCRLEWTIIRESRNQQPDRIVREETEILNRSLTGKGSACLLLDRVGQSFDSEQFAQRVGYYYQTSPELQFIIGGAYGVDRTGLNGIHESFSFSSMTFNHQIIRLMLMEQIYRAFCILHGKPYHK
ncbi:MAG: 23S rRNA (pseudouridine(1915)-N(3))-methyltransferase RlmH [Candidatus Delongbacteria bacterium]|nr:23S rRNA (pseudouridine(1915)-N(3))-methyltransferase RlmH [Candidatus Delongbacteria bacterium]